MTFSVYIQRQKRLIRQRHEGELFLITGDAVVPVRSSEEILSEMNVLKGLNRRERDGFMQIKGKRGEKAFSAVTL